MRLPAAYAFKVFGAEAKNAIPSLTTLLNDEETGEAAAVALTFIGTEAMPTLTNALSSTNLIMVRSVTSGLRVGGTNAVQAIPLLLINSTNADSKTRARSILVLGEIRFMPSTTLPRIIEALSDQDPFVRRTAIKAVGKYSANAAQALPKLVELTADPDPWTRYWAFTSIIQIEGVNGFPRYIDWLASFDTTIRVNANWYLKEFGRTNLTVRIALTNALESTNENIRIGATNVLERLDPGSRRGRRSP